MYLGSPASVSHGRPQGLDPATYLGISQREHAVFCLGNIFGILVTPRDNGREKTDTSWCLAPIED